MDVIQSIHLPPWPSFAEVVAAYIVQQRTRLEGRHEVGIQRSWPAQDATAESFEINIGEAPWYPAREVIRRTADRIGIGKAPSDHDLSRIVEDSGAVLKGDLEQRWEQREHNLFDVFEWGWYCWDIFVDAAKEEGFELDDEGYLTRAHLLIDAWYRSLGQPAQPNLAAETSPVLRAFRRQLPIYQTPGNLHHLLTCMAAVGHPPDRIVQEIRFWARVCEQMNARRSAQIRNIRDWFVVRGNLRLAPRDRPDYRARNTLSLRPFQVCLDATAEGHVHHLPSGPSSPCRIVIGAIVRTEIPLISEFLSPRATWPVSVQVPPQEAGKTVVERERFDLVVLEVGDGAILAARPQANLALDAVARELNWREPRQWCQQGLHQLRAYETNIDPSDMLKILRECLPRREIVIYRDRTAARATRLEVAVP
jgi:hypothetical protein